MNKILIVIMGLSLVSLVGYFIIYALPFLFVSKDAAINNTRCKSEKRALEEGISGIITNKFRDKDSHMWETIEYSNSTGLHRSVIFMNDQSGAFDLVVPGDSILKDVNSLNIKIIKVGSIKEYQLNFGCNQ